MKVLTVVFLAIFLSSCANYINKIHRELDQESGQRPQANYRKQRRGDAFAQFRQRPNRRSTMTQSNMEPKVKRQYKPSQTKRRYTADDLTDNVNEGSLWAGSGNDNYLFTKNKWKRNGDIVLVNVQDDLKNQISSELKRAFPPLPAPKKKKGEEEKDSAAQPGIPVQQPVAGQQQDNDEKIHDKISSVIIEEISKDHLLVRGQKFLLFRNRKHLIELQALVARRDIKDDDTIDSAQFLESSITILR